jgi:conjugative relaxase-like TrwC/TraI family protein
MVVTVAKATSVDYYTGDSGVGEGAESYYLDAVTDGEPAGQWSGSGAARLGLSGEVEADTMKSVYSDFVNPITGEKIGRAPDQHRTVEERLAVALAAEADALPERVEEIRTQLERSERSNVIGWDATFSVAKSVTVAHTAVHRAELAAIRSGDTDRAEAFAAIRIGIEDAIRAANSEMLAYAETLAVTRIQGSAGAPTQFRASPGLTSASFFQHTNRNVDPQLHVHNVILNRAFTADGKARALDGRDLLAQKHALGAVADRVLDERMTRLGFDVELRADGMARELTIVPTAVSDLFSSRDEQVTAKVAELLPAAREKAGRELTNLELYRLKKAATLSTRARKGTHVPETRGEMIERWWATTAEIGADLDQIAVDILDHVTERHAIADLSTDSTAVEWSEDAVIAEAVAVVAAQRSAWRPSDLTLQISLRLPCLGGVPPDETTALLTRLTDQAIAGPLVRQVSGRLDEPADQDALDAAAIPVTDVAAALEADPFTRPTSRLYASTDTLNAEEALRKAAIERGAHHLDADAVQAWLDEHAPGIGADQRSAVVGIASSDARLAVLVGPAGTGKSYAAGAFAHAWQDVTAVAGRPGRVIGLAVGQNATDVLRDDGVEHARNISQWLEIQDRLAEGSLAAADTAWRLGPTDVVMVDEASMVATAGLDRIQQLAEQAGARMVLTGDPRQLSAVEAGGVMGLLDGHAETYTLTEVRRFATGWEAGTSLKLRDGDLEALAIYDRHGRLLAHETPEEAVRVAARAAVADRLSGRSVVVITGTNDQAAAVASSVRDQLVALGLVEADGVLLGRDRCTAGVGDLVAARRNDYGFGVTNRALYQVTGIGEDGSMTVVPADRDTPPGIPGTGTTGGAAQTAAPIWIPAGYVAADVQLGYASTVHAAQGLTVDAAHLVTDGGLDAAALYVALTRGRLRNTAHVALTPGKDGARPAAAITGSGGEVRLEDTSTRPSARAVLETGLQREESNRAATVEAELDAERLTCMNLLAGRYEVVVRQACRERLDRHLDDLVTAGVLDAGTRARLAVDQGTEHLSRLLRAAEQAGADPKTTLTTAIGVRGLADADSVAQVLSHRITGGKPLPHPLLIEGEDSPGRSTAVAGLPADLGPQGAEHLHHLAARIDQRTATLGQRAAENPPQWALEALGPVPGTGKARADWIARAGTIEANREATGWDHERQPIGVMPGLAATERRASYVTAWHALGQPASGLDEAILTEGQLRVRIRAAQLERDWAPPHVHAALRATETSHEQARQAAAIARAEAEAAIRAGDEETADRHLADALEHEQTAALKAAAIGPLTAAAQTRADWAAAVAVTLDQGDRSLAEARRRGLTITKPDRGSDEWTAADEQAAREADDHWRVVTETDLLDDLDDQQTQPVDVTELDAVPETAGPDTSGSRAPADRATTRRDEDQAIAEHPAGDEHRDDDEHQVDEHDVDQHEHVDEHQGAHGGEHVHPGEDLDQDENHAQEMDDRHDVDAAMDVDAAQSQDDEREGGEPAGGRPGRGRGQSRSAAHEVLPEAPTATQVEAAAAVSALALARLADRKSQESSHVEAADLDDSGEHASSAGESFEAGLHRRDAADHQAHLKGQSASSQLDGSALDD